jgi:hypothetical protein
MTNRLHNDRDDVELTSTNPTHHASPPSGSEPYRDPAHWKTGDEPITASQKSYLSTLATEAGEPIEDLDSMTKAQASMEIDELQEKTGRGA